MPKLHSRMRVGDGEFTLAMTLLFALSLLAVFAGVAAIVGAFLAGMALSETVDKRVGDLTHGVAELLEPFFLVGIGLNFDLSLFVNAGAFALADDFPGGRSFEIPGLRPGRTQAMGRTDAMRVGVGMIPRGEVGMVVAQIGLNMGVMAHSVYGTIVFMSVATTLIAPPLLKIAFRESRDTISKT